MLLLENMTEVLTYITTWSTYEIKITNTILPLHI